MTVTYVGAGAVAAGNNATVAPALPAGVAAGDLMLLFAVIRNAGSGGTVNTPAGWSYVAGGSGFECEGRYYLPGDAAPSVSFGGGVANADTQAVILAFRGVGKDAIQVAPDSTQTNGSAANIAYPALDVPDAGHAVVLAAWKQDDSTAVSTPAGFTSAAYSSVTTGDDASLAVRYQIQTTETDIGSGSLTVTGGASAISRAILVALKPAPAITVQELDLFPPRTQVTVTGLTDADDVAVYRSVGGQRTLLRAGTGSNVSDPSFLVIDGEVPFGVPVTYVAVVNDIAEYFTAATTYTLPGGLVAFSDAITGLSAEATILAWDEKSYDKRADVFKVGGRNVVVTGELGMFTATLELYFEAYSAGQNFKALISNATEGVIQVRRPTSSYEGVDCYVAVLAARERRYSQDGTDPRRTWVIDVAETEAWADALEAVGFTYADVDAYYAPTGTYGTAAGEFATYLAARQADYSA